MEFGDARRPTDHSWKSSSKAAARRENLAMKNAASVVEGTVESLNPKNDGVSELGLGLKTANAKSSNSLARSAN